MARRSRGRPSKDATKTNIYVDKNLFAELELYLINPVKGRIQYGTFSALINGMLRSLLTHLKRPDVDPRKVLKAYGVELTETQEEKEEKEEEKDQHDV